MSNLPPTGKMPKGWHSRGFLPHFDGGAIPQNVTIRLIDSFPSEKLDEWKDKLEKLPVHERSKIQRSLIEDHLDKGAGEAWLSHSRIANMVQEALLHFNTERYNLHAWVVMPNHVHVLLTPSAQYNLSQIVFSWKSFTARTANKMLQRSGAFWQQDYFDRFIRNENHFYETISYIENNPVKAGLCAVRTDWEYTSANSREFLPPWTPPLEWGVT